MNNVVYTVTLLVEQWVRGPTPGSCSSVTILKYVSNNNSCGQADAFNGLGVDHND